MGRLWGVCNTPLHGDMKTHHGFHLPPHSIPQTQPVFGITRQNMPRPRSFFGRQGRGVLHTPHRTPSHRWRACTRPMTRPSPSFGGTFVGRMQYAPTWEHENAVRFMYPKAWHALKAAYFSGNTAEHTPTAIIFRPSG